LFIKTDLPPTTQLLFQNEHYLDVAAPVLASGKLIGWVKVGVSLAGVTKNLQVVTRDGLIYTVLAILIGIIFAIIMANSLTAGLKQLLLAIERVKLGEREVRADETRLDEIGYLARGFNAMIHAVKESDEKIKEAKQVAEAANIAKSQFIANMSHELRTPLNAVIGYSEMLQEEYDILNQEEVLSDLGRIHTAGKHLLSLINDILDLSKIESGKMEIFNETFDILKMTGNVISTVEILVEQHRNQLEFYHDIKCDIMYADLTKVRQILLNLLSNASKFTENGIVRLSVATFERDSMMWINFVISDNGIGIPTDKQQFLFQAFKQVDGSTTRKYGGTGLGLVISKRFVEMMGGTITLQSTPGQGTAFTVTLPTKIAAPQLQEALPIAEVQPAVTQKKYATVLVIDDDAIIRELLVRYLGKMGYRVVVADSGIKGLELAQQIQPDVITLDVMMPEMDGWTVLTELKKHPQLQHIPVIMLSIVENQELGYSLGAADYLLKPIDQTQILRVLQKYCTKKQDNYLIMVVEDDPMSRDLNREMLQRHGWQVTSADNGKTALTLAEKQPPDLILLDLMMPEMDGFEFITRLRHHQMLNTIPVVVLTAKDMTQADRTYLTDSVNAVFQKGGYDRDELSTQLQELLILTHHLHH
jgi:signal transduction histidine kinase/DNA-binding response OmpR family regulator